jgi:hypothetical protein
MYLLTLEEAHSYDGVALIFHSLSLAHNSFLGAKYSITPTKKNLLQAVFLRNVKLRSIVLPSALNPRPKMSVVSTSLWAP